MSEEPGPGAGTARTSRWRLRGESPTEPMPIRDLLRNSQFRHARVRSSDVEASKVRAALDLAARIGELMLRSGAGAPEVEGAVAAVAAAAGLRTLEVDITMQSLLIQSQATDGETVTVLRVVRSIRRDFDRLVGVHELVENLVHGELDVPAGAAELRRIVGQRRTWPGWAVSLASAVLAAAIATMLGASPLAVVATVAIGLVVSRLSGRLAAYRLPEFYASAIGAFVVAVLAWAWYAVGASRILDVGASSADFAYIVAAGIVALLPARSMASAVEDVLRGYPVTGAGRLLAVVLAFIGLVVGIALGLAATVRFSVAIGADFVSPTVLDLRTTTSPILAAVLGALVVGLSGPITLQGRRSLVLPAALLCLGGASLYAALTRVLDVGPITATGVAGVAIGVLARVLATRLRAPTIVLTVPASFGLLPGLTIFRGLYEMVVDTNAMAPTMSLVSGITTLLGALAVLLAIATGTVFGEILASPWDRTVRRVSRPRLR